MCTSFAPVLLILCSHLQGFITETTPFRIHKSTHNKHHVFLKTISRTISTACMVRLLAKKKHLNQVKQTNQASSQFMEWSTAKYQGVCYIFAFRREGGGGLEQVYRTIGRGKDLYHVVLSRYKGKRICKDFQIKPVLIKQRTK